MLRPIAGIGGGLSIGAWIADRALRAHVYTHGIRNPASTERVGSYAMADHRDGSIFPLTPKLLGFYHSLPPGQQGVFASIMTQASAAGEVTGFTMQPPDIQEAVDDALEHFSRALQGQST